MGCSICGQTGHNRRTCPNASRDRTIILRVDKLTQVEQEKLSEKFKKSKKQIASEEARAVILEGKTKEMPSKIQQLIEYGAKALPEGNKNGK